MSTEVQQLRLDIDVPPMLRPTPTEVHLGRIWIPRCRAILAEAANK